MTGASIVRTAAALFVLLLLLIVGAAAIAFDLHIGLTRRHCHDYDGDMYRRATQATEAATMPPPILHQTWKTSDLLPFQRENRQRWIGGMPATFDCRLHVDADFDAFVQQHFSWFWPTWQRLTPFIKKVDAIRYMWLYVDGGVYADLDLDLLDAAAVRGWIDEMKRCDATNDPPCLLVTSCSRYAPLIHTGPVFIVAHARHDFFLHMLHYIQRNADLDVLECTGPVAMTRVLKHFLKLPQIKHQANTSECGDTTTTHTSRNGAVRLVSSSACGLAGSFPLVRKVMRHSNSGLWKQ